MEVFGYVYLVRNMVNGKVYIGKTQTTPQRRFRSHVSDAKTRSGSLVHSAIRKYGEHSFSVVELHRAFTKAELNEMEKRSIWSHESCNRDVGYNIAKGGDGYSRKKKLQPYDNSNLSTKTPLSGDKHPLFGRPKSAEHVNKIQVTQKLRWANVERKPRKKYSQVGSDEYKQSQRVLLIRKHEELGLPTEGKLHWQSVSKKRTPNSIAGIYIRKTTKQREEKQLVESLALALKEIL